MASQTSISTRELSAYSAEVVGGVHELCGCGSAEQWGAAATAASAGSGSSSGSNSTATDTSSASSSAKSGANKGSEGCGILFGAVLAVSCVFVSL